MAYLRCYASVVLMFFLDILILGAVLASDFRS